MYPLRSLCIAYTACRNFSLSALLTYFLIVLDVFVFQKLYVCLFEKALVLTRPMARDGAMLYQVYSDPLLLYDLVVEDLRDGCVQSGSFKRVFTPTQSGTAAWRYFIITQLLTYSEDFCRIHTKPRISFCQYSRVWKVFV